MASWLFLPRILLFLDALRRRATVGSESVAALRTIVTLMPKTALVSSRTMPFCFPLVTNSFPLSIPLDPPSTRDRCSCLDSPVSGVKSFVIDVSALFSSSPSSSFFDNWASISSDEFSCHTILIRFWVGRTHIFSICTDFPSDGICDDFNSSNESIISTSLIHNIASDGKSEQIVALIFESYFPHQE